jgi:hypothetical protein
LCDLREVDPLLASPSLLRYRFEGHPFLPGVR